MNDTLSPAPGSRPTASAGSAPPAKTGPLSPRLRQARFAVASLFFLNGTLFATWVARIPALQAQHQLSHGQLGLALLAVALGAVIAMPLAGRFTASAGSENVCKLAALLFCVFLPFIAAAPSTGLFVVSLILFGAANGALDVAMNAQAVAVEERYGVPIMSSFHALFSTGGLFGAAMGGAVAALGWAPLPHFLLFAALFAAAILFRFPYLLASPKQTRHGRAAQQAAGGGRGIRTPGLVALGVVAACIMMGEGAMADWGAVYLRSVRLTSESVAATGYAAFSIAMAAGRFFGDGLTARLGPVNLVRLGGGLAAAGLSIALLVPAAYAPLVGFALVGLGFASIVPIVFSAAGRTPGIAPGVALATVSTMGYVGFLAGPPLIGLAAEWLGLPAALGLIVVTSLLCVALAGALRPRLGDRTLGAG